MAMVIEFLRTEGGGCLIEDFLNGLDPRDSRKVLWVFRLVEHLERVPKMYLEKLTGTEEIWAVRIQGMRQTYRVLGFRHRDALWLTNGYSKKSRRTDVREIARAERLRRDFLRRQRD